MLETVPKRVNAVETSPTPESNFGRWMALAAALLGMDVRRLRDGAVSADWRTGARGSARSCLRGSGHAVVRSDHRRLPRRRRNGRCVLRLARRPYRARSRHVAQHLHVCGVHRSLRICHRGVAYRGAPLRRLSGYGRRVVARRRAGQRNLAQQVAGAHRRAHRRCREPRIPHGRRAEHRSAPVHRRGRRAPARNWHA